MRLASLTILSLMASTSLTWAQSAAEDTFKKVMEDFNKSGFLTASVESQSYDAGSDTLTANNFTMRLSFKWDESNSWLSMFPPTPAPMPMDDKPSSKADSTKKEGKKDEETKSFLAFDMVYTAPSIIYKGLSAEGDQGYKFDQFDVNNAKMVITFKSHEKESDQTTNIEMKGAQIMERGYLPFMGEFKANPQKPFSTLLTYLRPLVMNTKIAKSTTPVQEATHAAADGKIFQRETHGPVIVTNVADGKIGSIIQAYQKGETDIASQFPDDVQDGSMGDLPEKITYEVGEIKYEGLDSGALFSLVDPGMPKYEGYKTALTTSSSGEVKAMSEKTFDLSIASTLQEGLKIKQPKTYLVSEVEAILPTLKAGEKPNDADMEKLIDAYFHLISSLSIDRFETGPIKAQDLSERDDPEAPQLVTLEKILLSKLSADGMEEFSLTNLDIKAKHIKQAMLGKFAITNMEFPAYEDVKKVAMTSREGRKPSPEEIAHAVPQKFEIGLEGLGFDDAKGNKISAKDIHLAVRTDGLTIPAHISLNTEELTLSRAMLSHPLAQSLMAQLNMNELTLNKAVTFNWDKDKETYSLNPLIIDLAKIAKLDGAIGFGGIKRDYLANPQGAQAAMATASILPAELTLTDQGGLPQLINLAGLMSGMSPDQLQAVAPAQIQAILGAYTKPDFAQHVSTQVGSFLKDPKSLRIMLAPSNPIPVAQILGVIATSPQMLPDILKIDVSANQL